MKEAEEYANAYSKQVGKYPRSKQKEFFGDQDWWMHPKREWKEMAGNTGDPFLSPGLHDGTQWSF